MTSNFSIILITLRGTLSQLFPPRLMTKT